METFALSEPVLLVLLSLAEQPRHGYSILKDIESMSDGRVLLSTGILYGALQRLLDHGWIERVQEENTPRDRRTYKLTSRGRRNLQTEIERMRRHFVRRAATPTRSRVARTVSINECA